MSISTAGAEEECRCCRASDEEEDHHVIQPLQPLAPGLTPVAAVIQRAGTEHPAHAGRIDGAGRDRHAPVRSRQQQRPEHQRHLEPQQVQPAPPRGLSVINAAPGVIERSCRRRLRRGIHSRHRQPSASSPRPARQPHRLPVPAVPVSPRTASPPATRKAARVLEHPVVTCGRVAAAEPASLLSLPWRTWPAARRLAARWA